MPPKRLKTEFHCHTVYSADSLLSPEKLVKACTRKGIDRVIVTDHNTIGGALIAQQIDPERVIVGEEILTSQGELLAAFVQEEIPPGLTPQETISRLREQGAFISVSHPFDRMRKGHWKSEHLLEILPRVDAIETFNSRCMFPHFNWKAEQFAVEHNTLRTVGSDAHTALELGRGSMLLEPFTDTDSLRSSLETAIIPAVLLGSPLIHFSSRFAVWWKKIKKGMYRD